MFDKDKKYYVQIRINHGSSYGPWVDEYGGCTDCRELKGMLIFTSNCKRVLVPLVNVIRAVEE